MYEFLKYAIHVVSIKMIVRTKHLRFVCQKSFTSQGFSVLLRQNIFRISFQESFYIIDNHSHKPAP